MSVNNQEQSQPNAIFEANRGGEQYVETDYSTIGNLPGTLLQPLIN